MTTDQLISKLYEVDEVQIFNRIDDRLIFKNISGQTLLEIPIFETFSFNNNFLGFHFMKNNKSKSEVLRTAYEYACTPVEERDK